MVGSVDHIGIAVSSIEQSLTFYRDILRLKVEGMEEVASQGVKVCFLNAGNTRLELLEPLSEESTVAAFIQKRGEGIHHIALGVESIQARIGELKEQGIRMIDEKARAGAHGAQVAFLHPKACAGVLYELCEHETKGDDSK
ncbi:methylmalonyl-CoA epimerase [Bacillus testis]|uniref:methylmalonyl-CoA epimerase n=1 Tax=Bacillus testis TaxID=1622072 RepID=UPI00067EA775|nr:methylmalonyl-CoA epimerase [Bacillus testis]